jgi:hypothetical protein
MGRDATCCVERISKSPADDAAGADPVDLSDQGAAARNAALGLLDQDLARAMPMLPTASSPVRMPSSFRSTSIRPGPARAPT